MTASTPENTTQEYLELRIREKAFVRSLRLVDQAVYSIGGRPVGGWPKWPGTQEIFPPIGEAALLLMSEIPLEGVATLAISGTSSMPTGLGEPMNTASKRDLVERIAGRRPDLKKNDINDIVALFMTEIGNALVKDERVELRDFGVFTPKERKARQARNPKTGEPVNVPATKVCSFKVGKELKQRLADSYTPGA